MHDTPNLRRGTRPARRGATMLMVLATLGSGTIIATAFLASRDNSSILSRNVVDASSGRNLAMSGVQMGIVILETREDWRNNHVDGKLLDDFPLGDGTFDLDLLDLETGLAPTDDTTEVEITCTAVVNGVEQTAVATVTSAGVPGSRDLPVPLDLAEFAVFSGGAIRMIDDATLTRWLTAPKSDRGDRIAIGTNAVAAGSLTLQTNAAAIDTTLYHGPGASSLIVSNATGLEVPTVERQDAIPVLAAPSPGVPEPGDSVYPPLTVGGPITLTSHTRNMSMTTTAAGVVVTARGDIDVVVDTHVDLASGSGVLVDGDVTMVVFGDLTMNPGSYIELTESAKLTMHVYGSVSMSDAYIGDTRDDHSDRDVSGKASWFDPSRITIYGNMADRHWELSLSSVVKGSMYLPSSNLSLVDTSALYGRAVAATLDMSDSAALFYDHSLDNTAGYTNDGSPLFDADGRLLDGVKVLTTFDTAVLADLASTTTYSFSFGDYEFTGAADVDDAVASTEPTPRPVPVSWTIHQTAGDVAAWEARAIDAFSGGGGP